MISFTSPLGRHSCPQPAAVLLLCWRPVLALSSDLVLKAAALCASLTPPPCRTTPMRIEPKTFFANERTFLTWLHMAVTVGTIAAALLGFSGTAGRSEKHPKHSAVSVAACKLLACQLCLGMLWAPLSRR